MINYSMSTGPANVKLLLCINVCFIDFAHQLCMFVREFIAIISKLLT